MIDHVLWDKVERIEKRLDELEGQRLETGTNGLKQDSGHSLEANYELQRCVGALLPIVLRTLGFSEDSISVLNVKGTYRLQLRLVENE